MKAMKVAAVATATVVSNISYAQPAPALDMPATLPGRLHFVQPEDAPQMIPALTSHLNSVQQTSSPANQSVSQKGGERGAQMISRPKNPTEFAENLKVIFDGDLLLQDAFYTDANLKDVFNLEEVSIFDDADSGERQISIMASVPAAAIPRVKVSESVGESIAGANFVGGKKFLKNGSISAGLNFSLYGEGPDFGATEKIFAEKFVRLPDEPSPHGGPPAATAPHGNETWKYRQVGCQMEKEVIIGFNPAGVLSSVLIEIKKNNNQGCEK
ncbi:hypothetical protein AB4851_14040 [Burkholderia sp. 22PA0099]|uniref:hypothetical protein n=1 Tax=Burkholderia sp. 22PA0099 TaxID=3237372 RepID=UPI0039C40F83